jgi:hypothetical protein
MLAGAASADGGWRMVVVIDKCVDLRFEITRQAVSLEQNAALQRRSQCSALLLV